MSNIPSEAALASAYLSGREQGRKEIIARILEAEEIDRRHGFTLPGDSALYIFLWGTEFGREWLERFNSLCNKEQQ